MKTMLRTTFLATTLMTIALCGCEEPPVSKQPQETAVTETRASGNSLLDSLDVSKDIDTSPSTSPPDDPTTAVFLGLKTTKPATWLWQPPKRSMRKANYLIPGRNGSEPAELIVTHFPEAPGNTPEANIQRWTSQFRSADGGPAKAEVERLTVEGMPVTLMEINGEYMGMGGAWHKADQRMIVAMVQAPAGSVFIKLLGPDDTVLVNREAFIDFIRGLKESR